MAKQKKTADELSRLLGTGDRNKQVEIVKHLLASTEIDVLIRVSTRFDRVMFVNVIGGQIPTPILYKVLEQAKEIIRLRETQEQIDQEVANRLQVLDSGGAKIKDYAEVDTSPPTSDNDEVPLPGDQET